MAGPSDALLRDLERIAVEVDALGTTTDDAFVTARRSRLLLELDVIGLFGPDPTLDVEHLPRLRHYRDAAARLRSYLTSAARARYFLDPPPQTLLDANVSLDWFRAPAGQVPEGLADDDWLALCERNFVSPLPEGSGTRFVRLERRMYALQFRIEVGSAPKLWRATLA